jgi:hypothetical protein
MNPPPKTCRSRICPYVRDDEAACLALGAAPHTASAALPKQSPTPATRHAALSRNLHTWGNYKNWSEQARAGWSQEPGQTHGEEEKDVSADQEG